MCIRDRYIDAIYVLCANVDYLEKMQIHAEIYFLIRSMFFIDTYKLSSRTRFLVPLLWTPVIPLLLPTVQCSGRYRTTRALDIASGGPATRSTMLACTHVESPLSRKNGIDPNSWNYGICVFFYRAVRPCFALFRNCRRRNATQTSGRPMHNVVRIIVVWSGVTPVYHVPGASCLQHYQ